MGRPENPVIRTIPAVGKLADYQRDCRTRAGLTYDQLAAVTGLTPTTLRRAASGAIVPPLDVVLHAVTACGGTTQEATELWKDARYDQRLKDNPRPSAPALRLVRSEADLSAALVELYEKAGAPSMALMEQRAGGHGRLGHSTAHRIVTRQTLPASRDQLVAFLDAVELKRPAARRRWLQAWDRVMGRSAGYLPDTIRGPRPDLVTTPRDLINELDKRRITLGHKAQDNPLQRQRLTHALTSPPSLVPSSVMFEKYLTTLGINHPDERPMWMAAWDRAVAGRGAPPRAA
ncbi:helix-turn-helix domain-containing protein [Streptomyces sp. NPDC058864]